MTFIEFSKSGREAVSPRRHDDYDILQKYRAASYKKPGRIHQFEYEFQVQDRVHFFVKPYPIPINHRVQVRKEI